MNDNVTANGIGGEHCQREEQKGTAPQSILRRKGRDDVVGETNSCSDLI
jgi:hypothetical protein